MEEGPASATGPETLVRLGIRIRSSHSYSEWPNEGRKEDKTVPYQGDSTQESATGHLASAFQCQVLCQENEIRQIQQSCEDNNSARPGECSRHTGGPLSQGKNEYNSGCWLL